MTYINSACWVFGGVNEAGTYMNDLHRLELPSAAAGEDAQAAALTWSEIKPTGEIPTPRAGAILLTLGKHTGAIPLSLHGHHLPVTGVEKLLLFGGIGPNGVNNDLYVLDLATSQSAPLWRKVSASGSGGPGRHHAAHCVLTQSDGSHPRLLISGGEGADGSKVRSTVMLDLSTWTWAQVDVHAGSEVELARGGSAGFVQSGRAALFGGATENGPDAQTLLFHPAEQHNPAIPVTRTLVDAKSTLPAGRSNFTLTTCRADGVVLRDEYMPNTLAPGATQNYLGAMHKRGSRLSLLDRRASGGVYGGSTAPPDEPGTDGPVDSVATCAILIGGTSDLSGEQRFGDVWRIVLDDDDDDAPEELHAAPESGRVYYQLLLAAQNGQSAPHARADHAAVAIPTTSQQQQQQQPKEPQQVEGRPGSTSDAAPGESTSATVAAGSTAVSSGCSVTSRILVFGGSAGGGRCLNDVHILEVSWCRDDLPTFSGETHPPGYQPNETTQAVQLANANSCCTIQ